MPNSSFKISSYISIVGLLSERYHISAELYCVDTCYTYSFSNFKYKFISTKELLSLISYKNNINYYKNLDHLINIKISVMQDIAIAS